MVEVRDWKKELATPGMAIGKKYKDASGNCVTIYGDLQLCTGDSSYWPLRGKCSTSGMFRNYGINGECYVEPANFDLVDPWAELAPKVRRARALLWDVEYEVVAKSTSYFKDNGNLVHWCRELGFEILQFPYGDYEEFEK